VNDRKTHPGVTLVELLLVLAIVVATMALAWPMLQKFLAGRRLQTAADEVRTEWCSARVEAMRSGRTQAFRAEVGGARYRTEPQDESEAAAARVGAAPALAASGRLDALAPGSGGGAPGASAPNEKTLPGGIRFVAVEPGEGAKAASISGPALAPPDDDASDVFWSEPIFFYPDGTASDVLLVLACGENHAMIVKLRGVTGAVTISDADSNGE